MRKFKKGGRRGTSKKKMMRKMLSSAARQVSSFLLEFLTNSDCEMFFSQQLILLLVYCRKKTNLLPSASSQCHLPTLRITKRLRYCSVEKLKAELCLLKLMLYSITILTIHSDSKEMMISLTVQFTWSIKPMFYQISS